MLSAYVDGCCAPISPGGTASYGVVVFKDSEKVWQGSGIVGSGDKMSNNVSEYQALYKLFEWLDKQPVEDITIYSDSQLLVNQMSRKWKVKSGLYLPYYEQCVIWMMQNIDLWGDRIKFDWIPREMNLEADELSKKELLKRCIEVRW